MKKDTLFELYDNIHDSDKEITDSLFKLSELNNESENIFLEFAKLNLVDKNNIDFYIDISECVGSIYDLEERITLFNDLYEVLSYDYISCSDEEDYEYILDSIIQIMDFDELNMFEIYDESDLGYYRSLITKEFLRGLKNISKVDKNKIYDHDFQEIIDSFKLMLYDLRNSRSINPESSMDQICLERIRKFVDVISDKKIYELDDEKYIAVLQTAKAITDVEELDKIKKIIKISSGLPTEQFKNIIDYNCSCVSELTIERINEAVGLKREYNPLERKTIIERKGKKKEKESDIVKKVLKPLD